MTIELTPAQARALADLAGREGLVALHQVPVDAEASPDAAADLYVTPHGSEQGFRIDAGGLTSPIGEAVPASK
jgi:hypothetical protein